MTDTDATVAALAPLLIRLHAEWSEAQRPVDKKVAAAALEGACAAAHAVGLGHTPFEVLLTVRDAFRLHGGRPTATSDNAARKAWQAQVTESIKWNI